jgi:hypothetical protein
MVPVRKIGTRLINNGVTTVVINRKIPAMCNNNSHLNAVAGIVVASVEEVAVAGVGEDWWAMDTRMAESENPVRFSRKEGE